MNELQLNCWDEYTQTKDFKKIANYIRKEYDLFKTYYNNLNKNVNKQFNENPQKSSLISEAISVQSEEDINKVLRALLNEYFTNIFSAPDKHIKLNQKEIWIHMNELIDCLNSEKVFTFDNKEGDQFNFKLFYQQINSSNLNDISTIVRKKLKFENFYFE
jgi:hypothetical protein